MDGPFKVLFLCTGNSARSIFGEYLIRKIGRGLFEAYSAGAQPTGLVNPYTLRVLNQVFDIDASDAWSKGIAEFSDVEFDFVITVCDKAKEACPVWPGQPIIAHWGAPDPAEARGTDDEVFQRFKEVAMIIHRRIELFCALPFDKIDRLRLTQLTREIGRQP
jgi:arsenate reductase